MSSLAERTASTWLLREPWRSVEVRIDFHRVVGSGFGAVGHFGGDFFHLAAVLETLASLSRAVLCSCSICRAPAGEWLPPPAARLRPTVRPFIDELDSSKLITALRSDRAAARLMVIIMAIKPKTAVIPPAAIISLCGFL